MKKSLVEGVAEELAQFSSSSRFAALKNEVAESMCQKDDDDVLAVAAAHVSNLTVTEADLDLYMRELVLLYFASGV